jgi:DNA-directed RNA polymerase specialized sigma subunit
MVRLKDPVVFERYKKVMDLRKKGLKLSEIGKLFGVSKQRVYYMIRYYKDNT